jgi:hypothetical protein
MIEAMLLAVLNSVEVLPLQLSERSAYAHKQQIGVAADGVERRAQLVWSAVRNSLWCGSRFQLP